MIRVVGQLAARSPFARPGRVEGRLGTALTKKAVPSTRGRSRSGSRLHGPESLRRIAAKNEGVSRRAPVWKVIAARVAASLPPISPRCCNYLHSSSRRPNMPLHLTVVAGTAADELALAARHARR